MKTQKVLLAVLLLPAILFGAMKFYEVVPHKNHIATAPGDPPGISQTFINVVDLLEKVSIWVGDVGNGARYFVEIRDLEDNVIASGDSSPGSRSWAWLDILLEAHPTNKPVRGKTYKAVFTRAGGAPISFAYDPTDSLNRDALMRYRPVFRSSYHRVQSAVSRAATECQL
ncbi:MAG: hypothetical protein R6X12_07535 [bacterium]